MFSHSSNWMARTLEWDGTRPATAKTLFLFEGQALGWETDSQTGAIACDFEKIRINLAHGFWLYHSERLAYAKIFEGVRLTKADRLLIDIARQYPHPALLGPLLQFAVFFSPALQDTIELMLLAKDQPGGERSVFVTKLPDDVGCYDAGYGCDAQYESCVDCGSTLGLGDTPTGGGGGGTLGNVCLESWLSHLQGCVDLKNDCRRFCPAVSVPPRVTWAEFQDVPPEIDHQDDWGQRLPDLTRCYNCNAQYEFCIQDADFRYFGCTSTPGH
jgi:hypothetical protein